MSSYKLIWLLHDNCDVESNEAFFKNNDVESSDALVFPVKALFVRKQLVRLDFDGRKRGCLSNHKTAHIQPLKGPI